MPTVLASAVALFALVLAGVPPTEASPWPVAVGAASWPLDGAPSVVRTFVAPPQRWLAGHRGVDLLASPGATVRTPIAGRIEFAARIVDRGVVVIRSGEVRMSLEPVTASVSVGDWVDMGDPVGELGPGANHCDPQVCLHWGLRVGEAYHDPLLLVGRYRAVLLP